MSTELYQGRRLKNGACEILADGVRLSLRCSLAIVNHSPTGFEWGYSGSGPAQTALAILLDFTGDAEFAKRWHQAFKEEFIAREGHRGFRIYSEQILAFVREKRGDTCRA